jgi:hypothetical protein
MWHLWIAREVLNLRPELTTVRGDLRMTEANRAGYLFGLIVLV